MKTATPFLSGSSGGGNVMASDINHKRRTLAILGISEAEERVYRWVLEHRGASVSETARALSLGLRKAQSLLESIEAKGLVTHSPERPRRYISASPHVALGAIFLQRQKALLETQRAIHELQEQMNVAHHEGERKQMVELITSREGERQILEQMERTAQEEFITLMRPPIRISRLDVPVEEEHPFQGEARARGVRYRSVVDADLMEVPEFLSGMRSDMGAGEEIRVIPDLPLKLVLADHRLALIPLNLEDLNSAALLVRSSALLNALYELFEMFWERAVPISFTQKDELQFGDLQLRLSEQARELIALLASGLNDKAIACGMSISKRTFERRIVDLMQAFNARSRFQTGWLAALRLSGRELQAASKGDERSEAEQSRR
ncbi:MAG: helix-turn-helix domain-containing protein [Gammaproteobacteria bacterium]